MICCCLGLQWSLLLDLSKIRKVINGGSKGTHQSDYRIRPVQEASSLLLRVLAMAILVDSWEYL